MAILQEYVIKEIAKEIANGNICYIHRNTRNLTIINNSIIDTEQLEEQTAIQAQLERKIEHYVKVGKINEEDQLEIMEYFLDEIPDKSLRKQVFNALKRQNPIRNFNQMLDNDIELNVHWRNFSKEEYQRWVSNVIIDAYNY